jgi:chloramphenicol-sensitive protein RarD
MDKRGILFAALTYAIWGFFPIYWKALAGVPAAQIVAHRLVWSLVFLAALVTIRREWERFRSRLTGRVMLLYFGAGALLTVNWLVYIYGVNAGFVVETSLGYFINPLVSILFGVLFFRERLSAARWIPIALAAAGVVYLTVRYGRLPWIALALAFTFGLYGLMKKVAPLEALHGLSLETAGMFLPALAFLLYLETQGTGAFGHIPAYQNGLLAFTGVITAVPLLLFAGAAHRIPLTMIGILQYISPTLQFLLGVLVYGEPFTQDRLIGFGMIWLALVIYTVGGMRERRKAAAAG